MADDPVDVIFRVWRTKNAEPFALFPGLPGTNDPTTCLSYARVGQHSSADPTLCIRRTRPAKAEEWAPLYLELRRRGYVLRPVKRATDAHYRLRREQTIQ